ncbi:MAG: hypothetical protein M0P11_09000, partial [Anaerolineaceae bacterium]|nr:hypothetical protein [Anaerolineaceae bacterium]
QAEGSDKAAESLKKTRYILMSSRETLQRKDREAAQGKLLSKFISVLFSWKPCKYGGCRASSFF